MKQAEESRNIMQKRKMGSIVSHRKRLMKENDVAFSGTWQHKTSGMDVSGVLYVRLAAHVSNGLKSRIRPEVGRI